MKISWLLFGAWIIATCNGSALKKPVKPDRFKIEHIPSPEEFTLPSRTSTSTLPPREFHSSWDNEEPSVSRTAGLAPSYPSLISLIFNRWSQASNKNVIEDNFEYDDEGEETSSSGRSKRSVESKGSKKKPRCLASLFGFGGDSILDSPPPMPDIPDYGSPSPFGIGGNLQGGIVSPGLGSSLGYPSQSQYTPGYSTSGSGLGSSLGRPSQYNSPGLGLGSSGSGLGVPSQYTPGLGLASDALKNSQNLESQLYGSQYNINSQLGGIPNSGYPQSPSGFRAFEPALGMFNSFIQILGSAAGRAIRDYSYSNGGNFPNFQLLDYIRPPPSINSLPPPPSIDFLPPPRGIKSLPPPRSIGSLPSPPSTDYLPPPP